MFLADISAVPVPGAIARGLAALGFVLRTQASRLRDINPRAYSIHELAEANWEWEAIVAKEEGDLHALTWDAFLGLPSAVLVRALLRHFNARFQHSYRFFRLTQRLFPGRYRWALAAPRRFRSSFVSQGLTLDQSASAVLWFLCKCALLTHALVVLLRSFVRALIDGARSSHQSVRPIVWLGLTAAELCSAPGELNAMDFARERRLPLFEERLPIYVATPWQAQAQPVPDVNALLCPDPIRAAPGQKLTVRDVLQLTRDSLVVAVRILRDAFRQDGLFLLLARDYAELPRMRLWFPKVRPRAVLMTNSMYASHPLWVAYAPACQCDVVMLFYATNVLPMYLRGGRDPVPGDPAYRLLECTRFEVWTESQKQWLVSLGIPETRVNVAGVIVWGRDDALANRRNTRAGPVDRPFRIGLFDVVPRNPTYLLQFGLGDSYYSFERMLTLLADVVDVASNLPGPTLEIVVKPKRARHATHDGRYFDLLDELVEAGKVSVGTLPNNPIAAVAACDMIISAPFSSPSVIAAQMNIPTCFYDPVGLLRAPPGLAPEAPLISGRDQLRQWMLRHRSATR